MTSASDPNVQILELRIYHAVLMLVELWRSLVGLDR